MMILLSLLVVVVVVVVVVVSSMLIIWSGLDLVLFCQRRHAIFMVCCHPCDVTDFHLKENVNQPHPKKNKIRVRTCFFAQIYIDTDLPIILAVHLLFLIQLLHFGRVSRLNNYDYQHQNTGLQSLPLLLIPS
jgi:hypothetical protein